ncbi:hypothetical protein B0T16DRAFT_460519 [Cercophora newfieldiana]|uniref:Uncharacterized protein n=1 Tax=Cercophora newfieldiana TaxID=92897 RepID=A0AA40CMY5_9PEZI|nr:hypothetical protein B0T16DRAFT_460519 [Cercophora newfieldiana]
MATCDFTTLADLESLDGLSPPAITQRAKDCPVICQILLGEGNPDLFGTGVFLSYALSFTLALIYGPYVFIFAHLRSFGLHKSKKPTQYRFFTRLAFFLLDHQSLALWSQLLFALAIATACAVRRQDPDLTSYESTTILSVTYINFSISLISWPSIFRPVEKARLFVVLVIVQVGLTYYLATTPPARSRVQWVVLDECIIPIGKNLLRGRAGISVGLLALQGGLLAAWGGLFWRAERGRSRHVLIDNARTRHERLWTRLAIGYILLTMVSFSALVIGGSVYIMYLRQLAVQRGALRALTLLRESEWGLGQIIAPFTWAPLIIDLGACVTHACGTGPLPDRDCEQNCDTCKRVEMAVLTRRVEISEDVENRKSSK